MGELWLWGAGNNLDKVLSCIYRDIKVKGIIDSNIILEKKIKNGLSIYLPRTNLINDNDTILITPKQYENVLKSISNLYPNKKLRVIPFWCKNLDIKKISGCIDVQKRELILMVLDMKVQIEQMRLKIENFKYEVTGQIQNNPPIIPKILGGIEALELVISDKKSLCRFGDGEFEMIFGRERPIFQKCSARLQKRLKEILVNKEEKIITCIADNYGCLDKYTEESANGIRKYMTPDTRQRHMESIDLKKIYYDAYISRPYIIYKKKERATDIFKLWKSLWKDRKVVLIEGKLTRNGYGNDLFQGVKSLERILCASENVWNYYDEIYQYIIEHIEDNKLLLITLGPTATVLAYDLTKKGYQAIDMGQLDNEYEWYVHRVNKRVDIAYKYVAECDNGTQVEEIDNDVYKKQIVTYIGC